MNLTAFQKLIRWLRNYRHFLTYRTFSMTKMKNPSIRVSIHTIITSIIQAKGFAISGQYCGYIENSLKDDKSYEYEPDHTRLSRSLLDNLADFIFTWNIRSQTSYLFSIVNTKAWIKKKHSDELLSEELFIILKWPQLLDEIICL